MDGINRVDKLDNSAKALCPGFAFRSLPNSFTESRDHPGYPGDSCHDRNESAKGIL